MQLLLGKPVYTEDITPKMVAREGITHRNLDVSSLKFEPDEDLLAIDEDTQPTDEDEYDETSPSI